MPSAEQPYLSVVVISFNKRREIPRTLHSLSVSYQKNICRDDYEIILVDNGSATTWECDDLADVGADLKVFNLREASSPSPSAAINFGLKQARGRLIGVMIDGARMVTPGLLYSTIRAARLYPRPIITSVDFNLGSDLQVVTVQRGYTQAVEDGLLDSIEWPRDGYRLFEISVFGAGSRGGWFHPLTESNALFMPAELWQEMGGYEERFRSAGGGLVNLDTYQRALALPGAQLIIVLGEANFHQLHGGIATNSPNRPLVDWREEYRRIRGQEYRPPSPAAVYFGAVPSSVLNHMDDSVQATRVHGFLGDLASDYIELLKNNLLNGTHQSGEGFARLDRRRADHLHRSVGVALHQHVIGDLMDYGAWQEGAGVLMRGILKASIGRHRNLWVADPRLASSLDSAKEFFKSLGLLDQNTHFLPDSFHNGLPNGGSERIAILRLDTSIPDALSALYPRVSTGGFVIIDDPRVPTQSERIAESFRSRHGITAPLERIDQSGVSWQKTEY